MNNVYLQLEASSGNLYEYSKTEKPGFERHEAINKEKVITVSYRRYIKEGIFGTLVSCGEYISKMQGREVKNLSVVMDSIHGNRYFINMPLLGPNGDIQSYAISVIAYMPALEVGVAYKFFPYVMDKKDGSRKTYAVSIKYARLEDNAQDDINKVPRLSFEIADKDGNITTPGDIPRTQWIVKMGQPTADNTNRNEFLYKIFTEHAKGSAGSSTKKTFNSKEEGTQQNTSGNNGASTGSPVGNSNGGAMQPNTSFDSKSSTPPPVATEEDDDDDLPF